MIAKKTQTGVGLLEVLVSLILLAISVLGFAALQMRASSATTESLVRTHALNIMRDTADRIRINSSQQANYVTKINQYQVSFYAGNATLPTNNCGLFKGGTDGACTPAQQAIADSYDLSQQAYNSGVRLGIQDCPITVASGVTATLTTDCLVASWNDTKTTIGTGSSDCMTSEGVYNDDADCIIMEMF